MNIQATIGSLSIRKFCNTKNDESLTADVKAAHKLLGKAGQWVKNKLNPDALVPVSQVATLARTAFYRGTLPWEQGRRLIPHAGRAVLESNIAEIKKTFDRTVAEFIAKYPQYVAEAKEMHNGTFNPEDYPSQSEIAKEFAMRVEIWPFPQSSHFDTGLRGLYGAALEEATKQKVDEAVRDTWNRILQPIRHMADKLTSKDAIFRDSLIDNAREIVALIPTLNVTGAPQMKAAAEAIKVMLAGVNPETLRDNVSARKNVAVAAKGFVAQFGRFGGRAIGSED